MTGDTGRDEPVQPPTVAGAAADNTCAELAWAFDPDAAPVAHFGDDGRGVRPYPWPVAIAASAGIVAVLCGCGSEAEDAGLRWLPAAHPGKTSVHHAVRVTFPGTDPSDYA
jgi:hypothetical protein